MMRSLQYMVVAVAFARSLHVSALQIPSQDPFYTTPASIGTFEPGEVIRYREIPDLPNISLPLPLKQVYQYLYRTTDSLQNPVAAVTTLLVPFNSTNPSKLLSYQIAYDSANNNCSPSYTLQASNQTDTDHAFISASLAKGWFVAIPDYEGLNAEYAAGIQAGYATLDSIRAVLNESRSNGVLPSSKTVIWGYSGGALASEWATELMPSYAPCISPQVVGVALGGLVPNNADLVRMINGGPNVGIAFLGIEGLSKAYPELKGYAEKHLIPSKKAEFDSITSKCTTPAIFEATNMSLFSYFDTDEGILTDPVPARILAESGIMGRHGVPQMPVFAYKSEGDQFSAIDLTDELVAKFCREGATIEYTRDSVGNHNTEAITGGAMAFRWIEEQFSGRGTVEGKDCETKNITLKADSIARVPELGSEVIAFLQQEFKSELPSS